MKLLSFLKKEAVLCSAAFLALLSCFFVPPDAEYLDYLDLRTLAILFSLMTVMAGLRGLGLFDRLGKALLRRTKSARGVVLVLVLLCFFGSMVITNDVALLTFVPFTFVVLALMEPSARQKLTLPVVCMQTLAANLGSMLTPIGNPQNLYLYGKSGLGSGEFLLLLLPYALVSLLLLLLWIVLLCRKGGTGTNELSRDTAAIPAAPLGIYLALFVLSLLTVMRLISYWIVLAVVLLTVLLMDRQTLKKVDYSLLLTFVAFFVFIGNLGRIPAFSTWLQGLLSGREVLVSVLASQVTSNVPAALLLSAFTEKTQALIIGVNLGGLGTLIASMASLISYRQIAQAIPEQKGRYFLLFTASNLIFLAVLLALWRVIR